MLRPLTLLARPRSLALWAVATTLGLVASGCGDFNNDPVVVVTDETPPAPPVGLYSITGDGQVQLIWNASYEPDLAGYRVYWSPAPDGPYALMATTSVPRYNDRDVDNGVTYFYAVTAFDDHGNESELSREIVHDTPRPEGQNLVLFDAGGASWELSGYDFDHYVRRPWSSIDTDMYFAVVNGRPSMVAADPATDLQDAGYHELADLDWAPPSGWTGEDRVTLIPGHSYYVWTRDDHYAKFRVTALDPTRVVVDWAFQIDPSNPELRAGR
jgi:hypothetical protein